MKRYAIKRLLSDTNLVNLASEDKDYHKHDIREDVFCSVRNRESIGSNVVKMERYFFIEKIDG